MDCFAALAMTGRVLSRIRWPDPPADVRPFVAFDHSNIVLALQIEPELRVVAEIPAKPHRRVCGDRAPSIENAGDPSRRHAEVQRQTVGTELAGVEFAFQK